MTEKPTSPFSGLDRALLRSTRPQSDLPTEAPTTVDAADTADKTPAAPPKPRRTPRRSAPAPADRPQASPTDSGIDSTIASMIAPDDVDLIKRIRATVKSPGREVSFIRLTAAEKARVSDIVYTYKRQG